MMQRADRFRSRWFTIAYIVALCLLAVAGLAIFLVGDAHAGDPGASTAIVRAQSAIMLTVLVLAVLRHILRPGKAHSAGQRLGTKNAPRGKARDVSVAAAPESGSDEPK